MALMTRYLPLVALLITTIPAVSASPLPATHLSVQRTSHGVVHVRADNYVELGFGLGFTYANDNLCQLASQIVTARGLKSQFHGGDAEIASDTFMRAELSDRRVTAMFATTSNEARDLIRGFVAGYNRYLSSTPPAARDTACGTAEWVMPMRETDVYRMIAAKAGSAAQFIAPLVDTKPSLPQISSSGNARDRTPPAEASNGWAFGKDATASGHGLLVANPHFPWSGENRFYQVHLTIPGKLDVMGATIAPIPVVVIGFNRDVAWTHTVSPADRFTLFRLALDPKDPWTYHVDGKPHRFVRRTVSFPVKGADGRLHRERHSVTESIFGPVATSAQLGLSWGQGQAFALADVNADNVGQIDTWLAYGKATSVEDIQKASKTSVAMPWLTTEAADRNGQVLFGDFSRSPNVDAALLHDCQIPTGNSPMPVVLLDGSRSRCDWTRQQGRSAFVAGDSLPTVIRSDYVVNSNDSYWLVNDTIRLPRGAPLMGSYASERNYRTRAGLAEIRGQLDAGGSRPKPPFTPDLVQDILFANRNYVALQFIDDILSMCRNESGGDAKLARACSVLSAWDRRNAVTSSGAVLFREFWDAAAEIPNLFTIPFSPDDPANTPRGLRVNDAEVSTKLRNALEGAVDKLDSNGIPLDRPLGEVQGIVLKGERIPVPGGPSNEGVLNSMQTTPVAKDGYTPVLGTSYIQIVGFDDSGPVARGLLAYGQSTDPRSAWVSDQTRLFAKGELYHFPFLPAEIVADPGYKVVTVPDDPILRR